MRWTGDKVLNSEGWIAMFDMFSFIDPIVDQDTFIAPADPQGNRYELYLLLQRLKAGGMSFEQFLTQAKAWAEH